MEIKNMIKLDSVKIVKLAKYAISIFIFMMLCVSANIAFAATDNQSSDQLINGSAGGTITPPTTTGTDNASINTSSGTKTGPGDGTYQLLVPLPEFGDAVQTTDFAKFLNQIIRLCIIFAGVLAVVKISIGGLKYMTTDSMNSKSEGKGEIIGAIFGLVVLAASYLILNTINPALLNLQLNVPSSGTIQPADTSSNSNGNIGDRQLSQTSNTSGGDVITNIGADKIYNTVAIKDDIAKQVFSGASLSDCQKTTANYEKEGWKILNNCYLQPKQ